MKQSTKYIYAAIAVLFLFGYSCKKDNNSPVTNNKTLTLAQQDSALISGRMVTLGKFEGSNDNGATWVQITYINEVMAINKDLSYTKTQSQNNQVSAMNSGSYWHCSLATDGSVTLVMGTSPQSVTWTYAIQSAATSSTAGGITLVVIDRTGGSGTPVSGGKYTSYNWVRSTYN